MKRFKTPWLALPVLALLLLAPLAATAEDDSAPSELDRSHMFEKGFTYALCAVSIVGASTGTTVVVAVLTCGAAFNYWFSE
jgi:hypothetical protein